jgi:dual specificity phosphatase 3
MARWHRHLCPVTPWLTVSGDLSPDRDEALEQIAAYQEAGITDILDVRGEWSDEKLVHTVAPTVRYVHLGTHDDGTTQDRAWYDEGLDVMAATRAAGGRILVHCHMGVNRGPSMAFAGLLDEGWSVAEALSAIRTARPIAGIIYAESAVAAVGGRHGWSAETVARAQNEARAWFEANHLDIRTVIRKIRESE